MVSALQFPALDLLYAFFFLLPGFLSLKTALYSSQSLSGTTDEFEKTAWSLLASGTVLSVLFVLFFVSMFGRLRLASLGITETGPVFSTSWGLLASGYLIALLLGVALGYAFGKGCDKLVESPGRGTKTRDNAWEYFLRNSIQEENREHHPEPRVQLRVKLHNGTEIAGYRSYAGDTHGDLLIGAPHLITEDSVRAFEGEHARWSELDKTKLGKYVYLPQESIDYVISESAIEEPGRKSIRQLIRNRR
ncbi:DUF6338 family protein [Natrinema sp. SYSU A 869]|uniref:DUF6338 family protein n=1 Tax=Natrinema sp. SYSU A 869 TaxID=2871694 RepID=UPI001CA3B1BC|nr:DUF6338 family protein [Natrinema sp. SYSU A 869]